LVECSANTSQKTPSSPDPRPPKTLRNRNRAIVQPHPALRFAVDVVSIAYRRPHRRPPLRSMRTDRLTLGRPRPPIADFWGTAEHTTWLHRAFRWHVPRKDHAVPPPESLTTLAHVPPLPTHSRFGRSPNRLPPSSERATASRAAAPEAPNASVVSMPAMNSPYGKSRPATAKKSSAAPSRSGTIEETPRKSPKTP